MRGCPRCLLAEGLAATNVGSASVDAGDDAPSPETIRNLFPGIEVLELLGRGGMGVVYRARQISLDRPVALKILPRRIAETPGFADRFAREARAMALLDHPNIVRIHEFGEREGLHYLVMEYVDGPNLRAAMAAGRMSPVEALAIVPQVCLALQYAHEQGIVHRDIKPENILLDKSGKVRIADFGLAKLLQRTAVDVTITGTGQIMGTLHYMAPEQYRTPNDVDHRADIYSLGVVLYEMLTGEVPVGTFEPPSSHARVDARLDRVVSRAMERDRARRYQTASEVGSEMKSVLQVPAAAAPPPVASAPSVASVAPPPVPAVTPILSRLAVAGCLATPVTMALFALAAVLSLQVPVALFFFLVIGSLVGWIVSIVSWIRIHNSGGLLLGKTWAIVGSILTPLLWCSGVPFILFALTPSAIHISEGPDGTRVRMPGLEVDEGPEGTRVKMPGIEVFDAKRRGPRKPEAPTPPELAGPSPTVIGGPDDDAARDRLVAEVTVQWTALREAGTSATADLDALTQWYDLATAERIRLMDDAQRTAERDSLGMPFHLVDPGTAALDPYVESIEWSKDGLDAMVAVRSSTGTVAFPMRFVDGAWRFATGPVEKR
jgi:predicted Ser/Thr protein kinase